MGNSETDILRWTGHPLVDVGVATLCAMAGKAEPGDVTLEELDAAAAELREAYQDPILVSYLSCVFTMNAPYTNPTMGDANRQAEIERVLMAHRSTGEPEAQGLRCVFSGRPATHLIHRAHMPMLTGAGVMNFFPAGRSELPVSGALLVALQALALGGRRTEGRLLIIHCDDPQWTLSFARSYLERNRKLIDLARRGELPESQGPAANLEQEHAAWDTQKKRPKYPDAKAPQSFVLSDLQKIAVQRTQGRMRESPTSVTVYVMSNSGQGPSLAIFPIPSQLVSFLQRVNGDPYGGSWRRLAGRSWRQPVEEKPSAEDETAEGAPRRARKKQAKPALPGGPGISRNEVYNDLCLIFETGEKDLRAARRFVRRHLLRDPMRWLEAKQNQPPRLRRGELEYVDSRLTELFLSEVLGMDKQRIERIRNFADQLAEFIDDRRDKGLFRGLVFSRNSYEYRNVLTKAHRNYAKDHQQLLFRFDEYLKVFLADDASGAADWSLVRDLISIRLVERLFELKFFEKPENQELLEEDEQTGTDRSEDETE